MITKSEAKVINHLGIINGICEKIKLVETIDKLIPVGKQVKLSIGMRVKAMVINALGFTGRPMYLTGEFYKTKPVGLLFGKDVSPEDINDDSLGRALDKIYEKNAESVFVSVSTEAVAICNINIDSCHLDTTSWSVEGEYKNEQNTLIRFGHSKDFRSDLKQFIQSALVTSDGGIPLIMKTLPGNTSDKTHFTEFAKEVVTNKIAEKKEFVLVFDSAGYTKNTLIALGKTHWVSRVPETIEIAKQMIEDSTPEIFHVLNDEYSYYEKDNEYAEIKQRWFLFISKHALKRETKTIQRNIKLEKDGLPALAKRFGSQIFGCKEDALKASLKLSKKLKFHNLSICDFVEEKHFLRKGKPKKGDAFEIRYKAKVDIVENTEKINKIMNSAGKFIIATNQLDKNIVTSEKILNTYKEQYHVEKGFRFLKNPISLIKSVYLKDDKRISALSMIMYITLLVYAIAEQALRKALVEHNETVENQVKKNVQNPTMRWIFQKMEDIVVLEYFDGNQLITCFMNMTEEIIKIITLLGSECMSMYGIST